MLSEAQAADLAAAEAAVAEVIEVDDFAPDDLTGESRPAAWQD
ncbi:Uncharacterised protein [Bordetella trematum]|nr:Uncharacterised protein [Bordetella trematum]